MQCKIERQNGRLTIKIGEKNYLPLAFKSFRPARKNISDFYNAGIRLFNVLTGSIISAVGVPYSLFGESWLDDEVYDFNVIDHQMDLFLQYAPEGYFSVMLQLDTRQWWLNKHEGYPNSFTHMALMEADMQWRELASKYMQAAICHIEEKYGDKVFGYFLLCGTTTEWFSDYSHEEPNSLVKMAYQRWGKSDQVHIPDKKEREREASEIFFDEEKDSDIIHYRKFEAWQRSDTIEFFFRKAQEIIKHKKLMGLYYGYLFELEGARLWETGHLDYERIFLSENIDMISSPISYAYRAQDSASQQMLTNTTLDIHDKVYFLEHDQTTCITPDIIEGHRFVHPNKAKTIEEDINLLRHDFMLAFFNGMAMWWFDMFGGWWYHPRFMSEIQKMITISNKLNNRVFYSVSEIAVIADPESMYYVNKNSGLNNLVLSEQRFDLSCMGAPYDLYSACDMSTINIENYSLFIFLSSFKENEILEAFIELLKKKKKTMLFSFACSVTGKQFNTSNMSRLLGFSISANPYPEDTVIMENKECSCSRAMNCFMISDDIEPLGYYKNSGACAVGYQTKDYTVAFCGLATIKEPVLRAIIHRTGIHTYTDNSDNLVYINSVGIGIYHRTEKDAVINVREDAVFLDVFENKEYRSENCLLYVAYDGVRAKLLVRN